MNQEVKIQIIDGEYKYIAACTEILQNSELGKVYFSDTQKAINMLEYAIEKKELHISLNEQDECVGFIYCMPNGVFGSYPYLHIISVKEDCRGNGIGRLLMSYFEDRYPSEKYFLTVDDFNIKAKKLYERLGYQCDEQLPDFYKKGIDCYLMMKKRYLK
ncbi:MAG: GNAT family N-acetyltransferase [Oscillospiraceae bacterium]|nr:GNAT family N-acetyltransferase [Oscillospiraceae bacterium]